MTRNLSDREVRRFANSKQVMHFIDRANPDLSDITKSNIAKKSAKSFYNWRRKECMFLETAEDLLDAFDLGYLLHTGDIETWEIEVQESNYAMVKRVQAHNARLMEEVREWKERALKAESTLTSLSQTDCKDCVKTLDGSDNA